MNTGRNSPKRRPLGGGAAVSTAPEAATPLPSALDGRTYEIQDSGSPSGQAWVERAIPGRGRMRVPLDRSAAGRRVRLHEMAHVKWTPVNPTLPDDVSGMTVQAVEDRRMHKRLHEIGQGSALTDWDAQLWHPDGPEWGALANRICAPDDHPQYMSDLDVGRMLAASDLTFESGQLRCLIADAGRQWVTAVVDLVMERNGMNKRRPAFKRTLEAGADLDRMLSQPPPGLDDTMREILPQYSGSGDAQWGTMAIMEMPLTDRLPRAMRGRKRRATDTGAVPRNMHRLTTDGRVFGARLPRPGGGTVLIDQSGSMNLDPAEVLALMEMYPGVQVATYAGSGNRGQLRIIARNGRRASEADCFHPWGSNVVDGPALEWLASQPGPRIWVSDGYVTGCGDQANSPQLLLEAGEIMHRGGIRRVDRFGELCQDSGGAS